MMKHFRILEIKNNKQYTIQYMNKIFFGLHYWKNLNNKIYNKYEDALADVKKVLKKEDYETTTMVFHYVDAYKILKFRDKESKSNFIKKTKK